MYRFEKSANQKMLAVALVAMLAICSFACVFSDETDAATTSGPYDINMMTGEHFSYAPATNLDSDGATITLSETSTVTGKGLTWTPSGNKGTLAGSFSTATGSGTPNVAILEASWTGGASNQLHQTATQTINFYVYDDIEFTGVPENKSYVVSEFDDGMSIATISKPTGQFPGTLNMTHSITKDNAPYSGDLFDVNDNTGAISAGRDAESTDEGTYKITFNATYSGNGNHPNGGTLSDSASVTYTVVIGKSIAPVGVPSELETYVNNSTTSQNQFTISTNYPDADLTITISDDSGISGLVTPASGDQDSTFTVNPSVSGINATAQDPFEFDITVTVTGDVNGDGDNETDTTTVHVIIYAELVFLEEPLIEAISTLSATGNALDAVANATFYGAKSITYNWGDGTQTHVDVKNTSNPTYAARHVYDSPGMYLVTITAENDKGTEKAYMLYDATNGAWAAADETTETSDSDKGFFEEHGYLFILFAILALLMVVVFFGVGIQHPFVAIAAIAFVILAVLCFLYDDFGLLDGFLDGAS